MQNLLFSLLLFSFLLSACTYRTTDKKSKTEIADASELNEFEFSSKIHYAQGFTITRKEHYKIVSVYDPWQKGQIYARYILVPKGMPEPEKIDAGDQIIMIPFEKAGSLSASHLAMISALQAEKKLKGISNPNFVYDPSFRERIKSGEIVSLGKEMDMDIEAIIGLNPDILIKTGFPNAKNEDGALNEAGIPVVYNNEWMETSLLGRAEWIKFLAAFFNREARADSVFRKVETNYFKMVNIGSKAKQYPSVLIGMPFKGTWYMSGGRSYMAQLLEDAGSDYYWQNDTTRGSIPLSFEVVLEKQQDCDFWFEVNARTRQEVIAKDTRYGLFKAFQNKNLFNNKKRMNKHGGNDYWQSGVLRPDLILADLIHIIHPEFLPNHQLYYYQKVK